MEAALRTAVGQFSGAPLRNGKIMRDLLAENRENFRAAAVSVLREPSDVRGCRYLVTILWTHDLLIPILGDSTLPKELVRTIAQTAAKVDPQLHLRLTRFLGEGMLEGKELDESSGNRLLEVLGWIADGPGIHRFIRQMLQHPSVRIRSKVTLLVEHGGPGVRALVTVLEDPDEDARVRANAIESLWSVESPELPALFRKSIDDPNNRVAGNAILALYLLGDLPAIGALFEMSASSEILAQTTAVWIMGRTKDSRFLPCVGRFMLSSKGTLRRTAFNALNSIKKAAAERAKGPRFTAHVLAVQQVGDAVQVRAVVTYPASAKPVEVPPTAFVLQLDSEPVVNFTCRKQQNALLCIAFVVPVRAASDPFRSQVDATLKLCLDAKDKTELWGVAHYQERSELYQDLQPVRLLGQDLQAARKPVGTSKAISFSPNALATRASLEGSSANRNVTSDAFETLTGAFAVPLPARAVRHAILIADSALKLNAEDADNLISAAKAAEFAISVVSTSEDSGVVRACVETGGSFRLLADADALQSELPLIYASIRSQYILEIPGASSEGNLPQHVSLSIHSETGTGECVWDRCPDPEPVVASDAPPQL